MLVFLKENISTIIIGLILLAAVVGIIVKMVRDKKKGRNSCGCDCANCPSAGMCHKTPNE